MKHSKRVGRVVLAGIAIGGLPLAGSAEEAVPPRPRLVVGIVVDQMRYDYLTRFDAHFSEGGFKRLQRRGTHFRSLHFDYVPTATAPGHAAVWTGAPPSISGIANNDFYDRARDEMVYCVADETVEPVGTRSRVGRRSPKNLLVSTVGDELKLATNDRAQVITISLKDRASILPGGHFADGAYWLHARHGLFVTSSYYEEELPEWVEDYNARGRVAELYAQPWTLRDEASTYTESLPDDNPFEEPFPGEAAPVFPHDFAKVTEALGEGASAHRYFSATPGGNVVVREMAEAALRHTELGRDDVPDILAVSFSATDVIGHRFGPNSLEIEDTYRRLDDDLARLLETIDQEVGLDKTVVFLSSDHGVSHNAAYLRSRGMSSAYTLDRDRFRDGIVEALVGTYGEQSRDWVAGVLGSQVVLDRSRIRAAGETLAAVQNSVRDHLLEHEAVVDAVTATELSAGGGVDGFKALIRRGAHATRSGDVYCQFTPGTVFGYAKGGAGHGDAFSYDTHAPFLICGPGIPVGEEIFERVTITQIAPTISALLRINEPAGAFSGPLPLFGEPRRR